MFNSKNYHLGFGCNCPFFVKSAICSHLVGYDIVAELGIFEIKSEPKTFVTRNKRGSEAVQKFIKVTTGSSISPDFFEDCTYRNEAELQIEL